MIKRVVFLLFFSLTSFYAQAQVEWLTFQQLDSALQAEAKPVFIAFYTDWCTYCKKMEQEVFTDPQIIEELNSTYYAVRFNAESSKNVFFDGAELSKAEDQRFHQLALLLAAQNSQFTPPALIFLNKEFEVEQRIFSYQSRKQLLKKLKRNN